MYFIIITIIIVNESLFIRPYILSKAYVMYIFDYYHSNELYSQSIFFLLIRFVLIMYMLLLKI